MTDTPVLSNEFRFKVTGYAGLEDEVLRLRNANRNVPQTRAYLDWRYEHRTDGREPRVFWLIDHLGVSVGMASLIFRPYTVAGLVTEVAILGDISVDSRLRGRGLGQRLLRFLTDWLDQEPALTIAMVIPNDTARVSLDAVGWRTGGKLIPHLFLLDPARRLGRLLQRIGLARVAAGTYQWATTGLLRCYLKRNYSLRLIEQPDASFESIWRETSKTGVIAAARTEAALAWRYLRHPNHSFGMAKFFRDRCPVGYIIWLVDSEERSYSIYEFVVADPADLECCLALFILQCQEVPRVESVRFTLSEDHPYRRRLIKLGFIPRATQDVFQFYTPGRDDIENYGWSLTRGDKDI